MYCVIYLARAGVRSVTFFVFTCRHTLLLDMHTFGKKTGISVCCILQWSTTLSGCN